MTNTKSAIYIGDVVHKRLRPVEHAFRYRVFALLLDVAQLDSLDRRLKLFSFNRFNLFSLMERDHGNGQSLDNHLKGIVRKSSLENRVDRFMMLCYPRILGYAFNPLTTYYGLDAEGRICLIVYEVNNTFGERQTYVLPASGHNPGNVSQSCDKRLYVSPFNAVKGTYHFHVTQPEEFLTLGIVLRDEGGPLLNASFAAKRFVLTDAGLLKALAQTGWVTLKVTAGIHFEAARLWFKGMKLVPRFPHRETPIVFGKGEATGARSGTHQPFGKPEIEKVG